jgi:hypothetical protein
MTRWNTLAASWPDCGDPSSAVRWSDTNDCLVDDGIFFGRSCSVGWFMEIPAESCGKTPWFFACPFWDGVS